MRPIVITDSIENAAGVCIEADAPPVSAWTGRHGYVDGLAPLTRSLLPGYDSGVAMLLLVTLGLLAMSLRNAGGYFKDFGSNLFEVKLPRGNNLAAPMLTTAESHVTVMLLAVTCLCEGILMYFVVSGRDWMLPGSALGAIGLCGACCMLFMAVQAGMYRLVGYIFGDDAQTRSWVRGFNASQSLLGLMLLAPALWSLYNPADAAVAATIGAVMYAVCRIIFISKGFRIFYNNIFSYVYFILYLCTLETAPLCLIYRSVVCPGN